MVIELSSTSKHIQQKGEAYQAIMIALLDLNGKYVKRTWEELYQKSGLTRTRFAMRLQDLIKMGSIKRIPIIDDKNRLSSLYEYSFAPVRMLGESNDVLRLIVDKKTHDIIQAEEGERVRSAYSKDTQYFRRKKKH